MCALRCVYEVKPAVLVSWMKPSALLPLTVAFFYAATSHSPWVLCVCVCMRGSESVFVAARLNLVIRCRKIEIFRIVYRSVRQRRSKKSCSFCRVRTPYPLISQCETHIPQSHWIEIAVVVCVCFICTSASAVHNANTNDNNNNGMEGGQMNYMQRNFARCNSVPFYRFKYFSSFFFVPSSK